MMQRRDFLALAGAGAAAQTKPRPNFIVIMTDDQGCGDLGCLGAADLKTPHIDALAAGGTRFSNWYSNAPVCAPSRASMFTGRYTVRAGVPTNGPPLTQAQKTTATLLKPHGYRTGLIGKWHLGDTRDTVPNAHGFDYFYGFHPGCVDFYSHIFYWGDRGANPVVNYHSLFRNREEIFEDGEYLTERLAQEAAGFIRRNRNDPFFLTVTFNAPHYPMQAPPRYKDRFPGLAKERQTYAAMLSAVDDGVGHIMSTLRQHALLDNTLVFFIADNGATTEARAGLGQQPATAGNNGPFRGFKFSLFDGGLHVPGIMHWPGRAPAGLVRDDLAMTMDILPTICKAAGVPIAHKVDGVDLMQRTSPGRAIFWENGNQTAVRRGHDKLVVNGIPYGRTPDERNPLMGDDAMFLSDLSQDPGESRNLRKMKPALADELATLIHNWREEVRR
jgi:arylsulfatase A-like enzyme